MYYKLSNTCYKLCNGRYKVCNKKISYRKGKNIRQQAKIISGLGKNLTEQIAG